MTSTEKHDGPPAQPLGRSVVTWGFVGGVAGVILGALIGFTFSTPNRPGFWMAVVGASLFLGAVCAFTAGIASLDAPPPGDEPTDPPPAPTDDGSV